MTEPYKLKRWLIFIEDSVVSTQKWVRERLSYLSDRTAILVKTQTAGRGRSGRVWNSPAGGFYASFLLKPSPPITMAPCVSLLAAVLISRLLRQQGIAAMVKWPNDVIVHGKKIAGIIAETGSFPENWFILGIGVNLTDPPFIPERKALPPGAWAEFGEPPSAGDLLEKFLDEFDSSWFTREDNPILDLISELNSILWNKGREVTLTAGSDKYSGIVIKVDDDGSLVLLTDSGERRFVSGELLTVPEERG